MLGLLFCLFGFFLTISLFDFFQVLHPAGALHSSVWAATFQERDCEWARPREAGAPLV